jgi:hypothetical protein
MMKKVANGTKAQDAQGAGDGVGCTRRCADASWMRVTGSSARNGQVEQLQLRVTCQEILDRFGPRRAPQSLRRLVTNGENLLLDEGINSYWGMFGRMRFPLADLLERHQVSGRIMKALTPLGSPGLRERLSTWANSAADHPGCCCIT